MVYRESLKLQSRDRAVSFHDVTQQVKEIAAKSGMKDGICVVYSHHTTCSVITQECAFDMSMTGLETLQQDLVNVFEEWIPTCRYEGMYLHPGRKALDFAESVGEDYHGGIFTLLDYIHMIAAELFARVIDASVADIGT